MEKNLQNEEALAKLKKLADEIKICMFITNNNDNDHTRPMATIEADDNGTLWFYTDIRSIKVEEVSKERIVHLVYSHPGKESYMDIWGNATIVTDRQLIKDKWSPVVKAYFPDGADDPNIALMKVQPTDAYFWESETGKMMQFLKMATAAVTGNPKVAESSEGKLNI